MKRELTKPTNFKGAHEMPHCTYSLSDMMWNNTGSWRYLRPGYIEQIPACQASCPAGEPIERWIDGLEKGNIQEAWNKLTTENPFPGLMGRVCFHPCETGCNRKDVGGAVTINMLERVLADKQGYEKTTVKPWKSSTGKKVAVVGSGPAGLACAYFSARLGHSVTVFEKFSKPGGLFRYGIPEYRLPKNIVEKELKKLYDLGIKFECGKALTKNDIVALAEKYDAVFLGAGAHISRPLGVEGEKTTGVMPALEYLENAQLTLEKTLKHTEIAELTNTKNVVVVGGGNSAVDAARMAIRLGAKTVTIMYRRSMAEMPAYATEVNDAGDEGIKLEMLATPTKVISENGRVKSLQCIRMKLGDPDSSGRRSPTPIPGSEFNINADLLLTAIGEVVDETILPPKSPKIFIGGDMLDQTRTVVNAIGSAKLASIEIDCMLTGKRFEEISQKVLIPGTNTARMTGYLAITANIPAERHGNVTFKANVVKTEKLNTYYFDRSTPAEYPKRSTSERLSTNPFAEVHISPAEELAKSQIERCMHCGHCTQCDNCYIYCPDVSIMKETNGYDISFDFCKGCGVCVKECPRAAMEMGEEPTVTG